MEKDEQEVYKRAKPFLIGIVALIYSFVFESTGKAGSFTHAKEFFDEFEKQNGIK